MKKILIIFLVLILLIIICFNVMAINILGERTLVISSDLEEIDPYAYCKRQIIRDNLTGVCYLTHTVWDVQKRSISTAITVMYDSIGVIVRASEVKNKSFKFDFPEQKSWIGILDEMEIID